MPRQVADGERYFCCGDVGCVAAGALLKLPPLAIGRQDRFGLSDGLTSHQVRIYRLSSPAGFVIHAVVRPVLNAGKAENAFRIFLVTQ